MLHEHSRYFKQTSTFLIWQTARSHVRPVKPVHRASPRKNVPINTPCMEVVSSNVISSFHSILANDANTRLQRKIHVSGECSWLFLDNARECRLQMGKWRMHVRPRARNTYILGHKASLGIRSLFATDKASCRLPADSFPWSFNVVQRVRTTHKASFRGKHVENISFLVFRIFKKTFNLFSPNKL